MQGYTHYESQYMYCIVLGLDDSEHLPDEQMSSQNAYTIESSDTFRWLHTMKILLGDVNWAKAESQI